MDDRGPRTPDRHSADDTPPPADDASAFAAQGRNVVYVEVAEGVFAPVEEAEALWRSVAQRAGEATEAAGHRAERSAHDAEPVDAAEPGARRLPTKEELLDPGSFLTPAERWAGLVGAAPGMTIAEKQRAAVALRYASDLAHRDIAIAMGCSEDAARRSVHEGLKRLREELVA
jgi:DNA-directed RNA polymerase specialized sigma24 family protein